MGALLTLTCQPTAVRNTWARSWGQAPWATPHSLDVLACQPVAFPRCSLVPCVRVDGVGAKQLAVTVHVAAPTHGSIACLAHFDILCYIPGGVATRSLLVPTTPIRNYNHVALRRCCTATRKRPTLTGQEVSHHDLKSCSKQSPLLDRRSL